MAKPVRPSELELQVLALLWRMGGATTRQVADGLAPHRTMGLSASQALLLRLEAKGLVRRDKIPGRNAYRYSPTRKARPAYRQLTRRFLDRVFGGNPVRLMATLFDTHSRAG